MEHPRQISVPVVLKGLNYVLWSRMVKTALGGRGLGDHLTLDEAPPTLIDQGEGHEMVLGDEAKWRQEDLLVLSILQSSLDSSILESYSHCETSKALWDTLKKVYGNTSNLSRVFELKQALNNLQREEVEFTSLFGKFSSLWAELDMLRPISFDPEVIKERREQDRVFSLFMVLGPAYNDLIKHILRSEKLPSLEDVCSQVQKERGSNGLFGGKGELLTAHKVSHKPEEEPMAANKSYFKPEDRRGVTCDHCKKRGHLKEKCWLLHPHLKPMKFREGKANLTAKPEASSSGSSCGGKALLSAQSFATQPFPQDDVVRRSDLDALIKALKENSGNVGNIFGTSYHARAYHVDLESGITHKPLIVDSGASHHMISDLSLIGDVRPALGNVVIANGDRIPIKGIGNLKLFDKNSSAFYMPNFTSNLLSVKRATTDLNCNVIFSPNDVHFQDIETSKLLGKGGTKDGLYLLEDIKLNSNLSHALNSVSDSVSSSNNALWHARLGHPHFRALSLLLPSVSFKNNECEACILGKHCKSIFPKSETVYDKCFDLVHSDVWTAPCLSRENHKYFVSFIDEKSKYTWITLMQSKDRVLEAFINYQNYITNLGQIMADR